MPLMSIIVLAAAALPQTAGPASMYQLTGPQVRQCATYALERNQRTAELAKRDEVLLAEQAKLTARQAELTAMSTTVNTKKKKDVEAYNKASAEFNAAVPVNSKNVADRNAYAATIPPLVDSYNAQCVKKSMSPTDVAALPDDLRTALTANTKTSTIMMPAPAAPAPAPKRRR